MVALIFWFLAALLCWRVFAGSDPATVLFGLLFAGCYSLSIGRRGTTLRFFSFGLRLLRLLPEAYRQGAALVCHGETLVGIYDENLEEADETLVLERIYLVTLTPDAVALGRDERGRLKIHGLEFPS